MLPTGCFVCHSQSPILTCPHCCAIQYCSPVHQLFDYSRHSSACKKIQELALEVEGLEKPLREYTPSGPYPENTHIPLIYEDDRYEVYPEDIPFIDRNDRDGVYPKDLLSGATVSLNQYPHGRDYLNARARLADSIVQVNTAAALDLAWSHYLELHRLCKWGKYTLSETTNILILRGEDQLCFSYISLWMDEHRRKEGLPFAMLRDPSKWKRDPFGDELDRNIGPSPAVVLVWLNLRWLEELETLRSFKAMEWWFENRLNYDVVELLRSYLVDSDVVKEKRELWKADNQELIERLEGQVCSLFQNVITMDENFWTDLVQGVEFGTRELATASAGIYLEAWKGRDGMIERIKKLIIRYPAKSGWTLALRKMEVNADKNEQSTK